MDAVPQIATETPPVTGDTAPSAAGETAPASRIFWLCFLACGAATLLPLWLVEFLPATDLPQHYAQIALWQQYDAGAGGDVYWLNWFTPYLFGYSLVRLVAFAVPIEAAFRVVLSAYVIALPLAMYAWLAALGRPRELALLAFPAAFGFSFQWGFFNYTCALPVALFFLAYGERHLLQPTRRSAAGLALFSVLLFFAHVMILAGCGVLLACRAVVRRGILGGLVALCPAALGALLVPPWMMLIRANHPAARTSAMGWEGWERLLQLPTRMFGVEGDTWAKALGIALVAWVLVSFAIARSREHTRFLVPAAALLLYAAMPSWTMDTYFLAQRFAVVFALTLVPALAWPTGRVARGVALGLLVLLVAAWDGLQLSRFRGFDEEARGLSDVLAKAEPGRSMLGLMYERESAHIAPSPFLHAPAYYQARKGGVIGFSFAVFFPELVRFRPGMAPQMTPNVEWDPGRFDWNTDGWYQYYLVRTTKAPGARLARAIQSKRVQLVAQSGAWSLYENRTAGATRRR